MKESPWKIRGLRGFQKGKVRLYNNGIPCFTDAQHVTKAGAVTMIRIIFRLLV
jgi:hypothetical protein